MEGKLDVVTVENKALVANTNLQTAQVKKLKPEKDSLMRALSEQNRESALEKSASKECISIQAYTWALLLWPVKS